MEDLIKQEELLTKFEKMLEIPFVFLVASFILYTELVSSYFYSVPALKWIVDIDQVKQRIGVYILALLAFSMIYALVLPVIQAVIAWLVNRVKSLLEVMSGERRHSFSINDGFWSRYSLETEADKQQSDYLQNKIANAKKDYSERQQELHTLAQRSFTLLVMGIANYFFAKEGIIQIALQYSRFTYSLIIVCLLLIVTAYLFAVTEAHKELRIRFKPEQKNTVLAG